MMAWLWPQARGILSSRSGTNSPNLNCAWPGGALPISTLQAWSFGTKGIQASFPRPQGLVFLLFCPGFIPPGTFTVEIKMGKEEEQKALILLLPWGQGLITLERQEVETSGAAFLKTGFILIFIIFSVFP